MTAMFDFPPYRPPSEADSALIRVTRGCPWNHCTFCGMYKGSQYELRPLAEIAADIGMLEDIFPGSQTVFIADSDSLQHPDILEVVQLISRRLPEAKRITSYARAHTLKHKGVETLKALREAGLSRVHVGLESGDRSILKAIRKGATPEIMIEGGSAARQAGLELCFYVLCGIGGETRWPEHADGTARVINAAHPDFVRLRTLTLVPPTPLLETWEAGGFEFIKPLSRLQETKRLIEQLDVAGCRLASDHVTNQLWAPEGPIYHGVNGLLPRDKERLVNTLAETIRRLQGREDIMDAHTLVRQGYIDSRL
jgi:coproporphyrinogen III oxidase-like Fe-S oxidoreductase